MSSSLLSSALAGSGRHRSIHVLAQRGRALSTVGLRSYNHIPITANNRQFAQHASRHHKNATRARVVSVPTTTRTPANAWLCGAQARTFAAAPDKVAKTKEGKSPSTAASDKGIKGVGSRSRETGQFESCYDAVDAFMRNMIHPDKLGIKWFVDREKYGDEVETFKFTNREVFPDGKIVIPVATPSDSDLKRFIEVDIDHWIMHIVQTDLSSIGYRSSQRSIPLPGDWMLSFKQVHWPKPYVPSYEHTHPGQTEANPADVLLGGEGIFTPEWTAEFRTLDPEEKRELRERMAEPIPDEHLQEEFGPGSKPGVEESHVDQLLRNLAKNSERAGLGTLARQTYRSLAAALDHAVGYNPIDGKTPLKAHALDVLPERVEGEIEYPNYQFRSERELRRHGRR
eukprot:TRINITY_DN4976_c0_g1_i1.p1 TRINITY_DN4976_c0_g1~~TRINITY_DN4976_c0_g1_i1.p1  ORF type:complete len:398 (+),score=57.24 TRINITY_DN4976_c0_g1_i1:307-1500(+)